MERTGERVAIARRALGTLEELVGEAPASSVVRDAAIQRFEYTFEAVWKAAQAYLRAGEGLVVGSPKGVVRLSLQVGIFTAHYPIVPIIFGIGDYHPSPSPTARPTGHAHPHQARR